MFWFQLTKHAQNIFFVCKVHYYNYTLNELGINYTFYNRNYTLIALPKDEIIRNHSKFLNPFNISVYKMEEYELQCL